MRMQPSRRDLCLCKRNPRDLSPSPLCVRMQGAGGRLQPRRGGHQNLTLLAP